MRIQRGLWQAHWQAQWAKVLVPRAKNQCAHLNEMLVANGSYAVVLASLIFVLLRYERANDDVNLAPASTKKLSHGPSLQLCRWFRKLTGWGYWNGATACATRCNVVGVSFAVRRHSNRKFSFSSKQYLRPQAKDLLNDFLCALMGRARDAMGVGDGRLSKVPCPYPHIRIRWFDARRGISATA